MSDPRGPSALDRASVPGAASAPARLSAPAISNEHITRELLHPSPLHPSNQALRPSLAKTRDPPGATEASALLPIHIQARHVLREDAQVLSGDVLPDPLEQSSVARFLSPGPQTTREKVLDPQAGRQVRPGGLEPEAAPRGFVDVNGSLQQRAPDDTPGAEQQKPPPESEQGQLLHSSELRLGAL